MSHQYENSRGQCQSDFKHDHDVVNTNQRQRFRLLWKLFGDNEEVYADSQQNGCTQSNPLAAFRWNEETHKDQHADDHAGDDREDNKVRGSPSNEKRHDNLAEIASASDHICFDLYTPQCPVPIRCAEFEI